MLNCERHFLARRNENGQQKIDGRGWVEKAESMEVGVTQERERL